jgi:hypothetical protein
MELNHRRLDVGQESYRWTTGLSKVDSSGIAPEFPTCEAGVFLLDDKPANKAEAVRLELTSDSISRHLFSRQGPHPAG